MGMLDGKRILLCVSGGIAAYKAAELVRLMGRDGAEVRVAMTYAAQKFVSPLTFQSLSGKAVMVNLFDQLDEYDGFGDDDRGTGEQRNFSVGEHNPIFTSGSQAGASGGGRNQ